MQEHLLSYTISTNISGEENEQSFRYDFIRFNKKEYLNLGQLTALTLLQGGAGLPVFNSTVAHYITTGDVFEEPCDLPGHVK